MTKTKKKRGRPSLGKRAKSKTIEVRVNEDERDLIKSAAESAGVSASEFLLAPALVRARRILSASDDAPE